MNSAEINEVIEKRLKSEPNAAFVDFQLTGHDLAKGKTVKVARGLKAKVLRETTWQDKPVTIVRMRIRDAQAHINLERAAAKPRVNEKMREHQRAIAGDVRVLRKHLARLKSEGATIVGVLWHRNTVPAPALVTIVEEAKLAMVLADGMKPNDMDFVTETQLTELRAASLKAGVPLEVVPWKERDAT